MFFNKKQVNILVHGLCLLAIFYIFIISISCLYDLKDKGYTVLDNNHNHKKVYNSFNDMFSKMISKEDISKVYDNSIIIFIINILLTVLILIISLIKKSNYLFYNVIISSILLMILLYNIQNINLPLNLILR
jgi:ABC-type maltose transport system permease subunit